MFNSKPSQDHHNLSNNMSVTTNLPPLIKSCKKLEKKHQKVDGNDLNHAKEVQLQQYQHYEAPSKEASTS
jgi:hypothetical protein